MLGGGQVQVGVVVVGEVWVVDCYFFVFDIVGQFVDEYYYICVLGGFQCFFEWWFCVGYVLVELYGCVVFGVEVFKGYVVGFVGLQVQFYVIVMQVIMLFLVVQYVFVVYVEVEVVVGGGFNVVVI